MAAILMGERDAETLAALADPRVKKSQAELVDLLQGQWDDALLYELRDCWELMDVLNHRIKACDKEIGGLLSQYEPANKKSSGLQQQNSIPTLVKKQNKGKHVPRGFHLQESCYRILGTDIFAVPGIGPGVALQFMAETGTGIYKFESAKQWASWLRLAPNNRISGGRVISSRTGKSRNALRKSLRDAANALGRSKSDDALVCFFRRIAFKHGRGAAITATARKLAVILWNMVVHKMPYPPLGSKVYQDILKMRKIRQLKRNIKKYAITIGELSTPS